jgi:hypothetical protein
VRFGRKRTDDPDQESPEDSGDDAAQSADPRAKGPWDVSEITLEEDDASRVDLGSLIVPLEHELDLQLQVDEASGEVIAVVLAGETGAAELRAFAAPRNGDIWERVRSSLAAEVAQLGGTATERPGPYGTELHVSMTVQLEDGSLAQQPSTVVGIAGPRWLLRVTMFGRPAVQPLEDGDVESVVRDVVVVRGSSPVPPGDALPLTMPPNARPAAPPV